MSCLLCELEDTPTWDQPYQRIVVTWHHEFAAECGGAPDQLDHYAWQHLSSANATTYGQES